MTEQTHTEAAAVFDELVAHLDRSSKDSRHRVIVVIGAAVSNWSGMQLWDKTAKELVGVIEGSFTKHLAEDLWQYLWEELSPILGTSSEEWRLTPGEFKRRLLEAKDERIISIEQLLRVACQSPLIEHAVRGKLEAIYRTNPLNDESVASPPQLACELLAHLVKHGYVNDLITFNFDEVLDEALIHELGPDGVQIISSPYQPKLQDDRPRLIKVHGTVSSRGTMRFTDTQTSSLPREIIELLDSTLTGSNNLVLSLGYAWNDVGIANWLKSRKRRVSRVLVVKKETKKLGQLEDSPFEITRLCVNAIWRSNTSPSIDELLWALCLVLEKTYIGDSGRNRPLPLSRHVVLGLIFSKRESTFPSHNSRIRFALEVILHLLKCKGMTTAMTMSRDRRITSFFDPETLDALCCPNGPVGTTQDHISSSHFAYAPYIYYLKTASLGELTAKVIQLINELSQGKVPKEILVPEIEDQVPAGTFPSVHFTTKNFETVLEAELGRIVDAPEAEIVRPRSTEYRWIFDNAEPLKTWRAFEETVDEVLKNQWTHLVVVSETGTWLTHLKKISTAAKNPQILLLAASDEGVLPQDSPIRASFRSQVKRDFASLETQSGVNVLTGRLAWYSHNRHLVLALASTEDSFEFFGGVYYRRYLRSSQIAPVRVSGEKDCGELFMTFLAYLRKACESEHIRLATEASVDPLVNQDFVSTAVVLARRFAARFDVFANRTTAALDFLKRLEQPTANSPRQGRQA